MEFFIIMSHFDLKQISKPGKVLVPRSTQRDKDKEKVISFMRKKDNRVRVNKPKLDRVYMRKMADLNDIVLKVKNQKIDIIKEIFQQKFNNFKAISFPFHNLSKASICISHQKEFGQRSLSNKLPINKVMRTTTFRKFVSVKPFTNRRENIMNPFPIKGQKISLFEHSKSFVKFSPATQYNTKRSWSESDEDRMDTSIYSELYLKT